MNNRNNIIIGAIVAALIIGGGSFYGGMKYQSSKSSSLRAAMMGNFGGINGGARAGVQRTGTQGGMMRGGVSGEVLSKDDKSITVKLQDGGSKIVFLSASTTVSQSVTGSVNDVNAGTQVMVIGSANSDGSVTAQSIQIKPEQKQ